MYGMLKLVNGKPRVCTTLYHGIWSNDIPVFLFDNLKDFEMEADESVLVRYENIVMDDKPYAFIIEYRVTRNIFDSASVTPPPNTISDNSAAPYAKILKVPIEEVTDGFHSFKELYELKLAYNQALFNEWGKQIIVTGWEKDGKAITRPKYDVHKSWKHNDGELCFGGGWFIVCANLPSGQISNHYEAKDWDMFDIPAKPKAMYPFDGHTTADVVERLKALNK